MSHGPTCPHCLQTAAVVRAAGRAAGADVMAHAIALTHAARAEGVNLDQLVEGLLMLADDLGEEGAANDNSAPRVTARLFVRRYGAAEGHR